MPTNRLPGLYEASAPVFLRYLDRLAAWVDIADAHARAHDVAPGELLNARLAPDMLPFEAQVRIAANFALRAAFPLAGRDIPPYGEFDASFDGLRQCIARVVKLVGSLEPAHFAGSESRILESRAGNALVSLRAPEFLYQYALPNFFFHLTTAYAILRSRGVAIGKEDFDGFHSYERNVAR
ncbi:MAG: DUF1993 domain-containing protein [Propionivibrio sp.]